eukprot:XP_800140.1 PREDICTED: uncharacterized protein LOC581533 [Strongylocentrotus purpuratus]
MNTFKMSIILIVSLCLLMTIGQSEARRYGKKNMRKIDDGGMERDRVERSLGSDSTRQVARSDLNQAQTRQVARSDLNQAQTRQVARSDLNQAQTRQVAKSDL